MSLRALLRVSWTVSAFASYSTSHQTPVFYTGVAGMRSIRSVDDFASVCASYIENTNAWIASRIAASPPTDINGVLDEINMADFVYSDSTLLQVIAMLIPTLTENGEWRAAGAAQGAYLMQQGSGLLGTPQLGRYVDMLFGAMEGVCSAEFAAGIPAEPTKDQQTIIEYGRAAKSLSLEFYYQGAFFEAESHRETLLQLLGEQTRLWKVLSAPIEDREDAWQSRKTSYKQFLQVLHRQAQLFGFSDTGEYVRRRSMLVAFERARNRGQRSPSTALTMEECPVARLLRSVSRSVIPAAESLGGTWNVGEGEHSLGSSWGTSPVMTLRDALSGFAAVARGLLNVEVWVDHEQEVWNDHSLVLRVDSGKRELLGRIFVDIANDELGSSATYPIVCGTQFTTAASVFVKLDAHTRGPHVVRGGNDKLLDWFRISQSGLLSVFHELSHALHCILSRVRLNRLTVMTAPIDYFELVSHLFELFARDWFDFFSGRTLAHAPSMARAYVSPIYKSVFAIAVKEYCQLRNLGKDEECSMDSLLGDAAISTRRNWRSLNVGTTATHPGYQYAYILGQALAPTVYAAGAFRDKIYDIYCQFVAGQLDLFDHRRHHDGPPGDSLGESQIESELEAYGELAAFNTHAARQSTYPQSPPSLIGPSAAVRTRNPGMVRRSPVVVRDHQEPVEENQELVQENQELVQENQELVQENQGLVRGSPGRVGQSPGRVSLSPGIVRQSPILDHNTRSSHRDATLRDEVEHREDLSAHHRESVSAYTENPQVEPRIPTEGAAGSFSLGTEVPLEQEDALSGEFEEFGDNLAYPYDGEKEEEYAYFPPDTVGDIDVAVFDVEPLEGEYNIRNFFASGTLNIGFSVYMSIAPSLSEVADAADHVEDMINFEALVAELSRPVRE